MTTDIYLGRWIDEEACGEDDEDRVEFYHKSVMENEHWKGR